MKTEAIHIFESSEQTKKQTKNKNHGVKTQQNFILAIPTEKTPKITARYSFSITY